MKKNKLNPLMLCVSITLSGCASNTSNYKKGQSLLQESKYEEAIEYFTKLGSHEAVPKYLQYCDAMASVDEGNQDASIKIFAYLNEFNDADYREKYYQGIVGL